MNKLLAIGMTLALLGAIAMGAATGSQLVYRPIDPAFGGDPLNGSWLIAAASGQSEGSQSPGFSIDFPDFGGFPQPSGNPSELPPVSTQP
jgi:curli production assembly/transport component CsgF